MKEEIKKGRNSAGLERSCNLEIWHKKGSSAMKDPEICSCSLENIDSDKGYDA